VPLTREDLDHMASHHCDTGRRRRRAFKEPVVLQGRCHDHVGTRVHYDPMSLVVVIHCHACDRFIIDVATTGTAALPAFRPIRCGACGPMTPVWPRYWYRTGLRELECFACGDVFASIPVQGESEEN
jgi:hypothetical protein